MFLDNFPWKQSFWNLTFGSIQYDFQTYWVSLYKVKFNFQNFLYIFNISRRIGNQYWGINEK